MDFLSRHTHGDKTCQAHWTDIQKKSRNVSVEDKVESPVRRGAQRTFHQPTYNQNFQVRCKLTYIFLISCYAALAFSSLKLLSS